MKQETYTHTVHCFDDKSLRRHFVGVEAATAYANDLLRGGHKVKIFPYKPFSRVDFMAAKLR